MGIASSSAMACTLGLAQQGGPPSFSSIIGVLFGPLSLIDKDFCGHLQKLAGTIPWMVGQCF
jgi:hypothetical protein